MNLFYDESTALAKQDERERRQAELDKAMWEYRDTGSPGTLSIEQLKRCRFAAEECQRRYATAMARFAGRAIHQR